MKRITLSMVLTSGLVALVVIGLGLAACRPPPVPGPIQPPAIGLPGPPSPPGLPGPPSVPGPIQPPRPPLPW